MINQGLINDIIILAIWLCLLVSCYTDWKYRIISNKIVIIIFILAILNFLFGQGQLNYGASAIFLICGLLMFYCRLAGAGDIKLITALLITIPVSSVLFFLVVITFFGLPLAIFVIIYKRLKKPEGGITLPYGIAISASYFLTSITLFKVIL
ncbi:prepilin peptidase [Gilliamella intestini]|uniref:Prepilin peptidase CpaA n=1 Tax=Gilliamella intestini TaxID=1798183 RepID=A0A1C3ZEV8_9GAMM|nr:prepilin peptidase [Gilliamella intestini]SCB80792.1 prepilin peptidase CpaA [Gilliamella intestini]